MRLTIDITVFFLLILISCSSRDRYEETYPDGSQRLVGELVENRRDGIWKQYSEDGELTYKLYYKLDSLISKETYINGDIAIKEDLLSGVRHGITYVFYDNGNLKSKSMYINGVQKGEGYTYFPDGTVETKYFKAENGFSGHFIQYYPNGQVNVLTDDIINGIFFIYDTAGTEMLRIKFENRMPFDTLYRNIRAEEILKSNMPRRQ